MRDNKKKRQVVEESHIHAPTSLLNIPRYRSEEANQGTGKEHTQVNLSPHERDGE